jgi:1-acyl-sn-glycerol-3-phosphate acyltransferase
MDRFRRLARRLAPARDEGWLQHVPEADRVLFSRAMRVLDRVGDYFRFEAEGCEHIPESGGALIAMPHTTATIDGFLLGAEILRQRGRTVRALGDHQLFEMPGVGELLLRLGAVDGRPQAAMQILRDGELCFVMPGGAREAWQPVHRRHELTWDGHYGFIKVALRAGVPIVPAVTLGAAESLWLPFHSLHWGQRVLGRRWPLVPPLGIGLTSVPIPTKWTSRVGPPIHLGHPPEAADDPEVVRALHARVRDTVASMIREGYREHRLFGGRG